nr:hypothetical protein [Paenalcaligenes hominis]
MTISILGRLRLTLIHRIPRFGGLDTDGISAHSTLLDVLFAVTRIGEPHAD